jgi:hypothetical protein
MASPMNAVMGVAGAVVGTGLSLASGKVGAAAARTNAAAQKISIQGQMLQTIGAAFGMETQAQQYGYQANINKYQAAVAELNKDISKQNAAYARDVGEVEAQLTGMKHRAELGEMIAAQGASGLDVNVGSAVKVRESMIDLGYYDQLQHRATAAKKAYGYEVEAGMNAAQADVYRYTATQNEAQAENALTGAKIVRQALPLQEQAMKVADIGGEIGVTGSQISAWGSVASKWMQASQSFF